MFNQSHPSLAVFTAANGQQKKSDSKKPKVPRRTNLRWQPLRKFTTVEGITEQYRLQNGLRVFDVP